MTTAKLQDEVLTLHRDVQRRWLAASTGIQSNALKSQVFLGSITRSERLLEGLAGLQSSHPGFSSQALALARAIAQVPSLCARLGLQARTLRLDDLAEIVQVALEADEPAALAGADGDGVADSAAAPGSSRRAPGTPRVGGERPARTSAAAGAAGGAGDPRPDRPGASAIAVTALSPRSASRRPAAPRSAHAAVALRRLQELLRAVSAPAAALAEQPGLAQLESAQLGPGDPGLVGPAGLLAGMKPPPGPEVGALHGLSARAVANLRSAARGARVAPSAPLRAPGGRSRASTGEFAAARGVVAEAALPRALRWSEGLLDAALLAVAPSAAWPDPSGESASDIGLPARGSLGSARGDGEASARSTAPGSAAAAGGGNRVAAADARMPEGRGPAFPSPHALGAALRAAAAAQGRAAKTTRMAAPGGAGSPPLAADPVRDFAAARLGRIVPAWQQQLAAWADAARTPRQGGARESAEMIQLAGEQANDLSWSAPSPSGPAALPRWLTPNRALPRERSLIPPLTAARRASVAVPGEAAPSHVAAGPGVAAEAPVGADAAVRDARRENLQGGGDPAVRRGGALGVASALRAVAMAEGRWQRWLGPLTTAGAGGAAGDVAAAWRTAAWTVAATAQRTPAWTGLAKARGTAQGPGQPAAPGSSTGSRQGLSGGLAGQWGDRDVLRAFATPRPGYSAATASLTTLSGADEEWMGPEPAGETRGGDPAFRPASGDPGLAPRTSPGLRRSGTPAIGAGAPPRIAKDGPRRALAGLTAASFPAASIFAFARPDLDARAHGQRGRRGAARAALAGAAGTADESDRLAGASAFGPGRSDVATAAVRGRGAAARRSIWQPESAATVVGALPDPASGEIADGDRSGDGAVPTAASHRASSWAAGSAEALVPSALRAALAVLGEGTADRASGTAAQAYLARFLGRTPSVPTQAAAGAEREVLALGATASEAGGEGGVDSRAADRTRQRLSPETVPFAVPPTPGMASLGRPSGARQGPVLRGMAALEALLAGPAAAELLLDAAAAAEPTASAADGSSAAAAVGRRAGAAATPAAWPSARLHAFSPVGLGRGRGLLQRGHPSRRSGGLSPLRAAATAKWRGGASPGRQGAGYGAAGLGAGELVGLGFDAEVGYFGEGAETPHALAAATALAGWVTSRRADSAARVRRTRAGEAPQAAATGTLLQAPNGAGWGEGAEPDFGGAAAVPGWIPRDYRFGQSDAAAAGAAAGGGPSPYADSPQATLVAAGDLAAREAFAAGRAQGASAAARSAQAGAMARVLSVTDTPTANMLPLVAPAAHAIVHAAAAKPQSEHLVTSGHGPSQGALAHSLQGGAHGDGTNGSDGRDGENGAGHGHDPQEIDALAAKIARSVLLSMQRERERRGHYG